MANDRKKIKEGDKIEVRIVRITTKENYFLRMIELNNNIHIAFGIAML